MTALLCVLSLSAAPLAAPAAPPTDLRVAALRLVDGAEVLTIASTSGEASDGITVEVAARAREVQGLPNGNLIVLEPGGALAEHRGADGLRVWGLPDAAAESFTLLPDGRLAVVSAGRLQLIDRLGQRTTVEAAGPLWAGSRLLAPPMDSGLATDQLQDLGLDTGARLLVDRGIG